MPNWLICLVWQIPKPLRDALLCEDTAWEKARQGMLEDKKEGGAYDGIEGRFAFERNVENEAAGARCDGKRGGVRDGEKKEDQNSDC